MVDALHAAGLEVVLDVVYNHTPEGNEFGPTLSCAGWTTRLVPPVTATGAATNLTGCGNTLHWAPRVAQFVLDALRHWVAEMGVDGFRFDLAPVLGRGSHGFDPNAAFFTALRQDPVLAGVHLIAEPWDAAYDGYQVGRFRAASWSGTTSSATRCAATGWGPAASAAASWRAASWRPATSSTTASACPPRRSTSSPCTTASRWPT
jgi:glycogen operon protein